MNLVSCLMPTRNRWPYVPMAVECFLNQTIADDCELWIHDDSNYFHIGDFPRDPRITVLHEPPGLMTVGGKLRLLSSLSVGRYIAAWSDDDWSHPERLERQVEIIQATGRGGCTLAQIAAFDTRAGEAWVFDDPERGLDGPLVFHRSYLKDCPFPERNRAPWGPVAKACDPIVVNDPFLAVRKTPLFVALRHGGNTWDGDYGYAPWYRREDLDSVMPEAVQRFGP